MPGDDHTAPPGGTAEDEIELAIDALYQGPLGAFVEERNRLARDLRGRDRDAAERVRTLAKPSVSAWAVNQAYWHARPQFSAMLDAGEALRALQQRVMRGEPVEGLAAASARLHEAVAPVARAAQDALAEDGHGAAPAIVRRVVTTLQAIAAHGRAATAPPAGRLSGDVSPPGFELLTALAPAHGPTPARRTESPAAPRGAPGRRTGAADAGRRDANDTGPEPAAGPLSDTAARDLPGAGRTGPRAAHRSAHEAPHRKDTPLRARQEARERHAARTRVADAKAALVARQREFTAAERTERAAAERLDAAEAAVTAARAALERATMGRDRAMQAHAQAQAEAAGARATLDAAREELESAEDQLRALGRDGSTPQPR